MNSVNVKGFFRVLRGGSWYYVDSNCEVSYRSDHYPFIRDFSYGFRVVRSLDNCEVDKVNEEGGCRVLRGSSWYDSPYYLRGSFRGNYTPGDSYYHIGFRLVRSLDNCEVNEEDGEAHWWSPEMIEGKVVDEIESQTNEKGEEITMKAVVSYAIIEGGKLVNRSKPVDVTG